MLYIAKPLLFKELGEPLEVQVIKKTAFTFKVTSKGSNF